MNHPNLTPEINAAIAKGEIEGGVFIDKLPVGAVLHVRTKNTSYTVEKRTGKPSITGQETVDYYISGHAKFCPEPTLAYIHGSTFGGSMLKFGFIGRGMHMEFSIPDHAGVFTTTTIQDITEVQ